MSKKEEIHVIEHPKIGDHYWVENNQSRPWIILVYNLRGDKIGGIIFDMVTGEQILSSDFAPRGPEWAEIRALQVEKDAPRIIKSNLHGKVSERDLFVFYTNSIRILTKFFLGDISR